MNGQKAEKKEIQRRKRLEDVIDAHQAALLRYAVGIIHDPGLAQDAVQEAFIALAKQWRPNQVPMSDAHLLNWLYKVVHNQAVSLLRKERTRTWVYEDYAKAAAVGESVPGKFWNGGALDHETQLRLLAESLDVLTPLRRQVLLLRLQQGLSHARISEITGRTVSHCRKLLHEAVRRLNVEVTRRLNAEEGLRDE